MFIINLFYHIIFLDKISTKMTALEDLETREKEIKMMVCLNIFLIFTFFKIEQSYSKVLLKQTPSVKKISVFLYLLFSLMITKRFCLICRTAVLSATSFIRYLPYRNFTVSHSCNFILKKCFILCFQIILHHN